MPYEFFAWFEMGITSHMVLIFPLRSFFCGTPTLELCQRGIVQRSVNLLFFSQTHFSLGL